MGIFSGEHRTIDEWCTYSMHVMMKTEYLTYSMVNENFLQFLVFLCFLIFFLINCTGAMFFWFERLVARIQQ